MNLKYIQLVSLKNIIGEHKLNGIDYDKNAGDGLYDKNDAYICFILDNEEYFVRASRLSSRMLENGRVKNKFDSVDVVCVVEKGVAGYDWGAPDIFIMKNKETNKKILEIGHYYAAGYARTAYSDYYPENL